MVDSSAWSEDANKSVTGYEVERPQSIIGRWGWTVFATFWTVLFAVSLIEHNDNGFIAMCAAWTLGSWILVLRERKHRQQATYPTSEDLEK